MNFKGRCLLLSISLCFSISFVVFIRYTASISKVIGSDSHENYVRRFEDMPLLLNLKGCKIPDISPWESDVMPLIKEISLVEDCWKTNYHWTYVNEKSIVINITAIEESGYRYSDLKCCYKVIEREEQTRTKYDELADHVVAYSRDCTELKFITTPKSGEFFMVNCEEKTWRGLLQTLYRHYHAIPSLRTAEGTLSKLKYWKDATERPKTVERPPNVIVMGIDSTSRVNFHRQMLKTRTVLQELDAIEMLGYTKVGENTLPNFSAMLSGYNVDDIGKICLYTPTEKQDDCPYIWKRFSQAQYLTAYMEDAPDFNAFNYKQTGFIKQPVDFYLRTLMLAAQDFSPNILNQLRLYKADHIDCVGYQTNDEAIVDYVKEVIEFAANSQTPLFSFSWSRAVTHNDLNGVRLIDPLYSDLLRDLQAKGHLNNTVLLFLSDHGYGFGKIRSTYSGWYEDRLPFFWIYVSPNLRLKFPAWRENLELNARRLTSPYHVYWMLNDILQISCDMQLPENSRDNSMGHSIERQFKNSLLKPVPEGFVCSDVGVPEPYCPCDPRQSIDVDNNVLKEAASIIIQYINGFLPLKLCEELALDRILSGSVMNKTQNAGDRLLTYIINFATKPGDFTFEAYIDYNVDHILFTNKPTVQRTNAVEGDVSCVDDAYLELYCSCK